MAGFTCATAGAHYFPPGAADAWQPLAYSADASGVARVHATVRGFALVSAVPLYPGAAAGVPVGLPVLGRAIVLHDASGGARMDHVRTALARGTHTRPLTPLPPLAPPLFFSSDPLLCCARRART
jgi:hypothetical protein